jgi:hypothetical protein
MSEYAVPIEDAVALLDVIPDYDCGNGPEPCVHTFVDAPFGQLGAHWSLTDLRAQMERLGVERAGDMARKAGHGLVVRRPGLGPLFIATREVA